MKVRKISFANKLTLLFIGLFLILDVILGSVLYVRTKTMLEDRIKENAMHIAECVAASVDGALLRQIGDGDEESEAFLTIHKNLSLFLDHAGVEYVYTLRKNPDGNMVFVVDSDPEEPAAINEVLDTEVEMEQALAGETSVNNEPFTDEWGTHISAYSPIYDGNEVVGLGTVDISMDAIEAETGRLLFTVIVVCVLLLAVMIPIMFLISFRIRKSFLVLNDKIEELSNGDGDLTRTINIETGDEFEVLGNSINQLVKFIRAIMVDIKEDSDSLRNASEQMAENINDVKSGTNEISDVMTSVSSTIEQTSASLNQLDDWMRDITDSFRQISEKLQNGEDYSGEIKHEAFATGERAQNNKDHVSVEFAKIQSQMEEKIEGSRAVTQINTLTENIIKIASQTNLLALNASIEAARAGDAGKGFAVVAGEIGNLAENSQEAAAGIREVSERVIASVNALAEEAQNMITFLETTTMKGYEELVEISDEYRNSADRFSELMSTISDQFGVIRDRIEQMKESTDALNTAVEDTSESLSKTAQKTSMMSEEMERLADHATVSNDIAATLGVEVGKFTL